MLPREVAENWESQKLSPYAARAGGGGNRLRPEQPDDTRTCFQRDADRILHSKAFRRLMHKTQVFLMPEGDHYRTRLTHALEVSRIARTLARALDLNEDLTEAIALGHDLGHAPFGHAGERALDAIIPGGFSHNAQSLRVVDRLEKAGQGLNLTAEVRDGLLHHSGGVPALTLEGRLVHFSDRIAYLSHDVDDSIRAGILSSEDVPQDLRRELGDTTQERINTFVTDLVSASAGKPDVSLSSGRMEAMAALRAFMFSHVYENPVAKGEEYKVMDLVARLYEHFLKHFDRIPSDLRALADIDGKERVVCDYIAGMTDRYLEHIALESFIPRGWHL